MSDTIAVIHTPPPSAGAPWPRESVALPLFIRSPLPRERDAPTSRPGTTAPAPAPRSPPPATRELRFFELPVDPFRYEGPESLPSPGGTARGYDARITKVVYREVNEGQGPEEFLYFTHAFNSPAPRRSRCSIRNRRHCVQHPSTRFPTDARPRSEPLRPPRRACASRKTGIATPTPAGIP